MSTEGVVQEFGFYFHLVQKIIWSPTSTSMILASNQSYMLMVSFGDDEYVLILESVDS